MGCYDRPEREYSPVLQEAAGQLSELAHPTIKYVDGSTDYDKEGRQAIAQNAPAILSVLVDRGIIRVEQLEALK